MTTEATRPRSAAWASLAGCILSVVFVANACALRTEDVEWSNGAVHLSGTLYLPDGKGPHPAFVFLHGSGPETRTAFTMTRYAREFAKHGIAMLLYDKRGAGKSTGHWLESDYGDLAEDAVQGIEMLARRDDIDPAAIGVIGASEGGWTGPIAANRSERVSLLILISAPPMSPLEQGIYEMQTAMRESGVSEPDLGEAADLERLRWRVYRSGEGWDELDRAIALARERPWYDAAGRPDPASLRSQWYKNVLDYDPLPALRQLSMPVLLLYGAKDPLVDARRSAETMEEIRQAEGKEFVIHVYPDSGHNLTLDEVRFPDDHWNRVFDWIAQKR